MEGSEGGEGKKPSWAYDRSIKLIWLLENFNLNVPHGVSGIYFLIYFLSPFNTLTWTKKILHKQED